MQRSGQTKKIERAWTGVFSWEKKQRSGPREADGGTIAGRRGDERFNEAVGVGRYGERFNEAASGGDNVDRVKRAGRGDERFNEAVGVGRYGKRFNEAASGGDNVDRVKRAGSRSKKIVGRKHQTRLLSGIVENYVLCPEESADDRSGSNKATKGGSEQPNEELEQKEQVVEGRCGAWVVDGSAYYEYCVAYVDDILVCGMDPKFQMDAIERQFKLKNGTVEEPSFYLGADIGKTYIDGNPYWSMASSKYTAKAIKSVEEELLTGKYAFKVLPKTARSPLSAEYRPEIDALPELDPGETKLLSRFGWDTPVDM
eukprot:jgi/Psemu1/56780/gm1.56780_g